MALNDDVIRFSKLFDLIAGVHSSCDDVQGLYKVISRSAAVLCDCEAAFLLFFDDARKNLNLSSFYSFKKDASPAQFTVEVGEGIAGWVAQHQKSLVLNDTADEEHSLSLALEKTGFPAKTLLAVPLLYKNDIIGVLELINKNSALKDLDKSFFDDSDVSILESFALQSAIAIHNASVFQNLHDQVIANGGQSDQNADAGNTESRMITKSPLMKEKLEIIDRLAKTDSSVLILGESGVGKELVAEEIHLRSPRKARPFIKINCAALHDDLAESELFGHIKGAFTGASTERKGRFELAHTGSIFLDEIADMPEAIQAKLLRVLQEKTFEKVGSDKPVQVDVRVLAATNKDIEKLIQEGSFRKDLYYRLNVLPVFVPPLRQRPEDIPELAEHFLKQCSQDMKKHFSGFSDEAMEALISYPWPGNIRELGNCVERACVTSASAIIERRDLLINQETEYTEKTGDGARDLKAVINAFKSHFIRKVLEEKKWNQTEAAKALDIQRTYLSRLIKELSIERV
jgi:Nif-specific regulatory protein